MNLVDDSLEWRSVLDALRTISVDTVSSVLGGGAVVAYTDGACIKNPGGPAGWSVLLWPEKDFIGDRPREGAPSIESYGHIPQSPTTTNNRAEITAVLAALSIVPLDQPLTIYSDSEYTIKVAQGIFKMKANNDLWALYRIWLNRRKSPPTFIWVRGHAGHDLNERADELAGIGAWNGDIEAYRQWQASNAPEAHNASGSPELTALRQQVQQLKQFFDSSMHNPRIAANERTFIDDMAKHLRKNNFVPSEKQANWVKGLIKKYGI